MRVGIIQRAGRGVRDVLEEGPGDAAGVEAGQVERRPSYVERVQRGGAVDEGRRTQRRGRGEEVGETRCVQCRRHRDDGEIVTQSTYVGEQAERDVGFDGALVHLVEDDGADARQFGVGEQAPIEQTGRDELDECRCARTGFAAYGVADDVAQTRPGQLGQTACSSADGDAARLGDDDAARSAGRHFGGYCGISRSVAVVAPCVASLSEPVRDERRRERRLARAGRGLDDARARVESARQLSGGRREGQPASDGVEVEGGIHRGLFSPRAASRPESQNARAPIRSTASSSRRSGPCAQPSRRRPPTPSPAAASRAAARCRRSR